MTLDQALQQVPPQDVEALRHSILRLVLFEHMDLRTITLKKRKNGCIEVHMDHLDDSWHTIN